MHRTTQRIDGGNINSVGSNADFGTQGLKTCHIIHCLRKSGVELFEITSSTDNQF